MDHRNQRTSFSPIATSGIVFIILGGIIFYQAKQTVLLQSKVDTLTLQVNTINFALSSATQEFARNFTDLDKKTLGLSYSLSNTQQNIDAVKTQVGGVQQTVGSISNTVGTLQKLAEVDPMILKKYSKVYFLFDRSLARTHHNNVRVMKW